MSKHVVQSQEWGKFKTEYGTTAVTVGNIQFTKHSIPFTKSFYGYCPKVNPLAIDFGLLRQMALENDCIAINFDVPNVLKDTDEEKRATEIFDIQNCVKAPKDTFAKYNVILDISKDEHELLARMHKKHRYNINYAQKNGLTVRKAETQEDFDTFFELLRETSDRQKYYIHPKDYYQKIWEMFGSSKMAHILTVYKGEMSLASWMLFVYDGILYYPYGGSSEKFKNFHPSTLLGWEAIRLGKELGCKVFDMWGAAKEPNDETDPWHGFTTFKLKYGGRHVEYMDSYDFILNDSAYKFFTLANDIRWKVLRLVR